MSLASGALLAVALGLAPASAGEPELTRVSFIWDAPGDCPDQREVFEDIAAVAGEVVLELVEVGSSDTLAPAWAVARVRRGEEAPWVLELELGNAWGHDERRFELQTCQSAAELTALRVGLALASDATGFSLLGPVDVEAPPEPEEPEPEPPREPQPDPGEPLSKWDAPVVEPETANARQPWHRRRHLRGPDDAPGPQFTLRLSTGPAIAIVDGLVTGELGLGLGARGRFWRLEAAAVRTFQGRYQTVSWSIGLAGWQGRLRVCGVPEIGPLEFPLCIGGEGGLLEISREAGDFTLPWAAIVPGVGISLRVHVNVALTAELQLPLALVRAEFTSGLVPVSDINAVSYRPLVALEVRLP